ncbi:hypothetical protein [Flavobacterium taihuense]|uniref:Uncharacterized protein n=1 Tax=Flavobacterium taihuense TaxID=2857508 RepID=A0ABS6XRT4_9FLAO|nr:hypothetical protein [Flavobacterium taihuense]MBW4359380.1 hypothetical protein [Flavobacterium taihuense]
MTLTNNANIKKGLTKELSSSFVKDFELATKTMRSVDFLKLFIKYDLNFIDDFDNMSKQILAILENWHNPIEGTEIIEMEQFDSKCHFCEYGKNVKVFKWTYQHKKAPIPINLVVYQKYIAFFLDIKNEQLVDFGLCNGYLKKEEIDELSS